MIITLIRKEKIKIQNASNILNKKRFPPENRHQLWKSGVPEQIKLPVPDWLHSKEFQSLFKMGALWLLWLYSL